MRESVKAKVAETLTTGSKAEKALASYILSATENIPFETAASLGERVGVSEATVGRYCRSMGFKSFKDLKEKLKGDLGDAPWMVSDRLQELQHSFQKDKQHLNAGMELEIAALVRIYEYAQTPEWQNVVKRLCACEAVFVAGFQTERGLAQYFANQLQYLRDRVTLMDLAGGNFAELLAADSDACLLIFEARRYSRLSKVLAQEARAAGIPVTLVTDTFCAWGPDAATEMFAIPTQFNQFWDSTAHMASFGNLLLNGVFVELGMAVEPRLKRTAELYGKFIGHVGDPASQIET
ncbi:MurR/RpiR family transcriptional regulator [Leisingera sp. JC1]|uniref:MurR/RpiR family transcriptional regulator n=1 Tax=Leisingera sp. JC1 TaxID=1855282 RepID=UPI000802D323|nr:MurR/RpiR family transcriptional regulator [Leisingera sp. JC1]OBY25516.1 RpiR family transcriptional regulator [Leisingera sp. JC1]